MPGAADDVSAWLPYGIGPLPQVISRSTTTGRSLSTMAEKLAVPRFMARESTMTLRPGSIHTVRRATPPPSRFRRSAIVAGAGFGLAIA